MNQELTPRQHEAMRDLGLIFAQRGKGISIESIGKWRAVYLQLEQKGLVHIRRLPRDYSAHPTDAGKAYVAQFANEAAAIAAELAADRCRS
jgi:hypothetical protein